MFEAIKNRRTEIARRLEAKSNSLERAKINNERIENLQMVQRQISDVLRDLSEYRTSLSFVETAATKEAKDYQTRRVEYLNAVITDAVNEIFPQKHYTAKLSCQYLRSDSAKLRLMDEHGNVHLPAVCEGKLMQYLVSFSAVSGIVKALGCGVLFVDEAFGAASPHRMGDIGKIIQKRIDEGMQIILIAQNSALYNELSRHEIHLVTEYGVKHGEFDKVVVQNIVDI